MKLKFEKVEPPEAYTAKHWNRPRNSGKVKEYFDAIENMKVDESFETEGVYCLMESIRKAFKDRGWKCTCRTKRLEKFKGSLRIFKIRVWRVA